MAEYISDIDDTIKHSDVRHPRALLRNIFRAVPVDSRHTATKDGRARPFVPLCFFESVATHRTLTRLHTEGRISKRVMHLKQLRVLDHSTYASFRSPNRVSPPSIPYWMRGQNVGLSWSEILENRTPKFTAIWRMNDPSKSPKSSFVSLSLHPQKQPDGNNYPKQHRPVCSKCFRLRMRFIFRQTSSLYRHRFLDLLRRVDLQVSRQPSNQKIERSVSRAAISALTT